MTIDHEGENKVLISLSKDGENPIANPKELSFTLDTQTTVTITDAHYDESAGKLIVSGTGEAGASVEIKNGNNVLDTVTVGNNGQFSSAIDFSRATSAQTLTIKATATDIAENTANHTFADSVIVPAALNNDNLKIAFVENTGVTTDSITKNAALKVTDRQDNDLTDKWVWRVNNRDNGVEGTWHAGSGNRISHNDIKAIYGDGNLRVEISLSEDGTTPITPLSGKQVEGFNFKLDTQTVKPSINSSYNENTQTMTIYGEAEAGATVVISASGKSATVTANSNGSYTANLNIPRGQTDGNTQITVNVTDIEDNQNSNSGTSCKISGLPQSDNKVEKAQKAIQDLVDAVNEAEKDGTVEHNEYKNLNDLRTAADNAIKAVGQNNSAYQGLISSLNSAANYVRGTTAEQAQKQLAIFSQEPQGTAEYDLAVLNSTRKMNNLENVTLTTDNDTINDANAGAQALTRLFDHNSHTFNQSANISGGYSRNHVAAYMDDYGSQDNLDKAGHRMSLLQPKLNETAIGHAQGGQYGGAENMLVFGKTTGDGY